MQCGICYNDERLMNLNCDGKYEHIVCCNCYRRLNHHQCSYCLKPVNLKNIKPLHDKSKKFIAKLYQKLAMVKKQDRADFMDNEDYYRFVCIDNYKKKLQRLYDAYNKKIHPPRKIVSYEDLRIYVPITNTFHVRKTQVESIIRKELEWEEFDKDLTNFDTNK